MSATERFQEHYRKADRIMIGLIWLMALCSLGLAFWYQTFWQAILIGGGTAVCMTALYPLIGGSRLMRCLLAAALMVMAALHINQAHGMIETHFGVFAILAVLTFYRDWLPILVAALTIAVHHVLFHYLQYLGLGIYVMPHGGWTMVFVHAGYVVLETAILLYLAQQSARDANECSDMLERICDVTNKLTGQAQNQYAGAEKVSLVAHFDRFIAQLNSLVSGVSQDARNLNDLGQDLTSKSSTLNHDAKHQLQEVEQISAAMTQMGQSMQEVAAQVDQSVECAHQAEQRVRQGLLSVDRALAEINQLAEVLNSNNSTVQTLAKEAEKIGGVLEVISSIAEQTNLLALNAAIEAARAGEQGRGFAVVADEVRSLAQRTAVSTQEIGQMIEALQSGSRCASSAMQQSSESVSRCVQISQETAAMLHAVAEDVSNIDQLSSKIADTTHEQSSASQHIAEHLHSVQSITQHTASEVENLAQHSQDLIPIASRLNALGHTFQAS